MKPITKIIAVSTVIVYSLFIIHWYLISFIWVGLPEYIPNTPIKINSFILAAIILPVYWISGKVIRKTYPEISVGRLTIYLAVIGITSEILFQISKLFWVEFDVTYIAKRLAIAIVVYLILAFLTAYEIVTKRRAVAWILTVTFLIAWKLLDNYVLSKVF